MNDGDSARRLHELTVLSPAPRTRPPELVDFAPLDPGNRPEPFKRYPSATLWPLPTDLPPAGPPALDVLAGHAPDDAHAVDAEFLARLLFHSAGVTRMSRHGGGPSYFRAAPSAGNLHPLEVYVVNGELSGLPAGVHHFAPDAFGLEELRAGDHRGAVGEAAADAGLARKPVTLVITGIPWRTAWKYGERGWRHIYWDAGAMLSHMLAVAAAYGVHARVLFGFLDADLCRLIGLDGRTEFPVVMVELDDGESHRSETPESPASALPELRLDSTRLSPGPIEFPLVTAAQQAGHLNTADDVAQWREALTTTLRPGKATNHPAPTPEAPASAQEPIETIIRRRGSTRVMRPAPMPADAMTWMLGCATRPAAMDSAPTTAGTVLSHKLSVHSIGAFEPGLYDWDPVAADALRTMPEAGARATATHLCLDQPLGGDSAYTLFTCADLDDVLRHLGDRGYRVAQTEAGIVVGRLQLAAFALDRGATGLTFFDDEVSAAFSTSEACMMVCAVGEPDYRPVPGGSPGNPAELSGMDRLTRRLVQRGGH